MSVLKRYNSTTGQWETVNAPVPDVPSSFDGPYITQKPYRTTNLNGNSMAYEVVTVHTNGRFIPGLVEAMYANDWDVADGTESNMKPVRETVRSLYDRHPYGLIANAAGYRTSGNTDEVIGLQIKDGVIYHDFTTSGNGSEAIGFKADGSSKTYKYSEGATAASLIADGVVTAFSFGPLLVRDGVMIDWPNSPFYGSYHPQVSARQIVGQTASGDIKIISIMGATGVSGANGTDMSNLVTLHGLHNALTLDGGGSVQTLAGGYLSHASSDAVARPVPVFFCVNAPLRGDVDTGYINQSYASGFTYTETDRRLQARRINDVVHLAGTIKPTSGTFAAGYSTAASLTEDMYPDTEGQRMYPAVGASGGGSAFSYVGQAGLLVSPTGTVGWVDYGGISYPAFRGN